jgi:Uma2 family endonuclease
MLEGATNRGSLDGTIAASAGPFAMLHTRLMIAAFSARPPGPYTWDDFVALEDDDRRELIDGELLEVEVPTDVHEYIVAMLTLFIMGWARRTKKGYAFVSGYKVRISERRGVMPDLQLYLHANKSAKRTAQGLVGGHPDLAIEILSSTSVRYDRVIKLGYYASIAVPEYWVVDPSARTLERLVLDGGRYRIEEAASGDDVVRPASFDGLEIPLGELWTIPTGDEVPAEPDE